MNVLKVVLKIVLALAAVAGAVYVIATYGDKIVAWAKKMLGCCSCKCDGECECDGECDCDGECKCECDGECCCQETEEAPADEAPAEEPAAPEVEAAAEDSAEVVATEADFEG